MSPSRIQRLTVTPRIENLSFVRLKRQITKAVLEWEPISGSGKLMTLFHCVYDLSLT